MHRILLWWNWVITHQGEVAVGAVFAAFFAVLGDLFAVDSRTRAGIRHIKNKLSEQSTARLRVRIKQLESQRLRYIRYMSSDKALYLVTFQGLLFAVVCLGIGSACSGIADVTHSTLFKLWSVGIFGGVAVFGIQALRFAVLDSEDKVAKEINKIDSDLAALNKKLSEKTGNSVSCTI